MYSLVLCMQQTAISTVCMPRLHHVMNVQHQTLSEHVVVCHHNAVQ